MIYVKVRQCVSCSHEITNKEYHACNGVCPHCGHMSKEGKGEFPDVEYRVEQRAESDGYLDRHEGWVNVPPMSLGLLVVSAIGLSCLITLMGYMLYCSITGFMENM